jgi:hypothetical protein
MTDKEIVLVRAVRPADPPHDPAVKARAWARLHAEFTATDTAPSPGATRTFHRSFGRRVAWRLAAAGVVAAGVAAAVVATQVGGPAPEQRPAARTAAQTLELAAERIEQQAAPPRPGPHQWIYTEAKSANEVAPGNRIAMLHNVKLETWWRFDGRLMASSIGNGKLDMTRVLQPGERQRPGHVDPRYDGYVGGPAFWDSAPRKLYDYVAGLPSDPDALLARVRHDYHDSGKDVTTFGKIAEIFRDDRVIPPKKQATLYRALAKIRGVRIVPNARDYAGRRGIGLALDTAEEKTVVRKGLRPTPEPDVAELVLDSRTYAYIGDGTQAILSTAVVDKAGLRG